MNLLEATADPQLFAPWFRDRETWRAWFAFVTALFGYEMSEEARSIYRECTARPAAPTEPSREAYLIIGRRGGKSFVLALIATFLAISSQKPATNQPRMPWRVCLAHAGPGAPMPSDEVLVALTMRV